MRWLESPLRRDLRRLDCMGHPFEQHLAQKRLGADIQCWCVERGRMILESEGGEKVFVLAQKPRFEGLWRGMR